MTTATETQAQKTAQRQAKEIEMLETLLTERENLYECQTCGQDIRYGCSDDCTETVKSDLLTPELEAWIDEFDDEARESNYDGIPNAYDWIRLNSLDMSLEGVNRGDGWEITGAAVCTGLGGPNVWVETDGRTVTVSVAWWSDKAEITLHNCDTVAADLLEAVSTYTQS